MRLLRGLGFVAYLLLSVCLLLVALEFVVRLAFPRINHQDTDRSLFLPPAADQGLVRWRPRASGISFGEAVEIDQFGYRDMPGATTASNPSWLLLGDSVTFGVGVDARETFAARLQAAHPEIKIWNSAVVGYGIDDYLDVVKEFLAKPTPPSLVLLFFCLNDPAGRFHLENGPVSLPQRALGWLGRHSKLYVLMKRTLADRSKAYFSHDVAFYDATNPAFRRTVQVLDEIRTLLSKTETPLLVVVLPYEYQLRRNDERDRVPQQLLVRELQPLGIPVLDLYGEFITSARPTSDLFLYADAMHLSRAGHELVFGAVSSQVSKITARQPSPTPRATPPQDPSRSP